MTCYHTTTWKEGLRRKSLQYNHRTLTGTNLIKAILLTVCDTSTRKINKLKKTRKKDL